MADTKDTKPAEATTKAVAAAINDAAEKGHFGGTVDPTPRENYSVAGVTSGKPTPETDEKAAEAARAALR